jgi:hypothetical protein
MEMRSPEYAHSFLELNDWACLDSSADSKSIWIAKIRTWLTWFPTFAAVYVIYLGIVLPFARVRYGSGRWARNEYDVRIMLLGIPFAIAVLYIWKKLTTGKLPK